MPLLAAYITPTLFSNGFKTQNSLHTCTWCDLKTQKRLSVAVLQNLPFSSHQSATTCERFANLLQYMGGLPRNGRVLFTSQAISRLTEVQLPTLFGLRGKSNKPAANPACRCGHNFTQTASFEFGQAQLDSILDLRHRPHLPSNSSQLLLFFLWCRPDSAAG